MSNINAMIKWMTDRQEKVSYSMNSRLGPGSYDCSSAVYNALIAGGFLKAGSMGNTETLFNDLERNGWQQVQPDANGNYPAKRGDIGIWGTRGHTLGAAGHTFIFVDDNDNMIHCNYGYNGITVNDHDTIWSANGQPEITIYRYKGKQADAPATDQDKPNSNKTGGNNMYTYVKKLKNGNHEVWFVNGATRMYLPTDKHVKEANDLIKRYGGSTNQITYNYDNYGLKMIEMSTQVAKF
ncbi:peptidoglycan amidohydrolase family protein [Enterococcus plantarum]|uniref:peptidoglycan amidohydrolase family protein n=1 Tax=Enterococcus plantarum TaxID=1077675 RepID=UPI0021ACEC29|nr:peptidoglycan amidohydrolase family protein [Enterococcus plantarum]